MAAELARLGHPMLAALLTVGLSAPVHAETPPEALQPAQEAPLAEELELIKEDEKPVKNGTNEGGHISINYGLKRSFKLKDGPL